MSSQPELTEVCISDLIDNICQQVLRDAGVSFKRNIKLKYIAQLHLAFYLCRLPLYVK